MGEDLLCNLTSLIIDFRSSIVKFLYLEDFDLEIVYISISKFSKTLASFEPASPYPQINIF